MLFRNVNDVSLSVMWRINNSAEELFVWIMLQNVCVGVYKTEYGFVKSAFKLIIIPNVVSVPLMS